MPIGLLVMKWDERVGTTTLAKYPDELVVSDKTLMQIYSTYEYTQEAGMISMIVGASSIASYYTGPEQNIYVILVLTADEDADVFEEGLADITRIIVENLENNAFEKILPSLFQRVSVYPALDEDQKLMIIYYDETKRLLLQRLREEGSVLKSEISVWLKDKYKSGFIDMESIIASLIKMGLIKQSSVKGLSINILFLINDIIMYRAPATELLKNPESHGLPAELGESYFTEVKNFFTGYTPSEEDNLAAIEVLLDPQVYETVKLLKQAIVTRDDIEKLKKKGVEDVDYVLKKLWDNNFLVVLQDSNGTEYYGLKTLFRIKRIFPEYLINIIKQNFNDKVKNPKELVEHLEILEDAYMTAKAKARS
ncbi:MAG: hypothetical protein ACTSU2_00550 [Promethearchaeota archaeon]